MGTVLSVLTVFAIFAIFAILAAKDQIAEHRNASSDAQPENSWSRT